MALHVIRRRELTPELGSQQTIIRVRERVEQSAPVSVAPITELLSPPSTKRSSRAEHMYTPQPLLDAVSMVLGSIDLDPCSNAEANERVKAAAYITEELDGLVTPWEDDGPATIWISAPIGKHPKGGSYTSQFWDRLMRVRLRGGVKDAIFLAIDVEHLQSGQRPGLPHPTDFPICLPSKRIRYTNKAGVKTFQSNTASFLVYVPGLLDRTGEFLRVFGRIGDCMLPVLVRLRA